MSDAENITSQKIEDFISFLENAAKEYAAAKDEVDRRSQANFDYLHDLEFASNKNERNRVATKVHKNQIARREAKDRMQLNDKLAKFYLDQGNRPFFKKLKSLIAEQKKTEEYLQSDRHYTRRVGEKNEDDS